MSEYVTNAAWVRQVGRPDAVDDVADQFERATPVQRGTQAGTYVAWPRRSRGWRSFDRLRPHGATQVPVT